MKGNVKTHALQGACVHLECAESLMPQLIIYNKQFHISTSVSQ